MPVRSIQPSDLQVVKDLLQQLGYRVSFAELASRIDRVNANATHFVAVSEEGGNVLGLIHAYDRPAIEKTYDVVVQSLVVDRAARNTGVGKGLMMAAETWARTRGAERVVLYTRTDRDNARVFYERIGFTLNATSHLMSKPVDRD